MASLITINAYEESVFTLESVRDIWNGLQLTKCKVKLRQVRRWADKGLLNTVERYGVRRTSFLEIKRFAEKYTRYSIAIRMKDSRCRVPYLRCANITEFRVTGIDYNETHISIPRDAIENMEVTHIILAR